MGAKASHLYLTDWDKADGLLKHYETLDHMEPSKQSETWRLSHDSQIRQYKITRQQPPIESCHYNVKIVPHSFFWFDLLREDEPILQVRGHPWGSTWDIFSYRIPSFSGQEPVEVHDATDEANHPLLFLKARIQRSWRQDRAHVRMCTATSASSDMNKPGTTWSDPILVYVNADVLHGRCHTFFPQEEQRAKENRSSPNDANSIIILSDMEQEDHKTCKLTLAKGCDVALHLVLAVMSNTIHSNMNPYMAHAYDDGFFVPTAPVGFMY